MDWFLKGVGFVEAHLSDRFTVAEVAVLLTKHTTPADAERRAGDRRVPVAWTPAQGRGVRARRCQEM